MMNIITKSTTYKICINWKKIDTVYALEHPPSIDLSRTTPDIFLNFTCFKPIAIE